MEEERLTHMCCPFRILRSEEVMENVKISSVKEDFVLYMNNVRTMPEALKSEVINWNNVKMKYRHLKDIDFPEVYPNETADILIGADQTLLFQQLDQRIPERNGDPIAVQLPLGWLCMGKVPYRAVNNVTFLPDRYVHHVMKENAEVSNILLKFWNVERFSHTEEEISLDSQEVMKNTRKSTRHNGERYEISLPFNSQKVENVAEHFKEEMWTKALKRLESTKRSVTSKGKAEAYQEVLDDYMEKGYLRIVDNAEDTKWLLPHFAVIREEKETSKLRIVFDAAAKVGQPSLNDQLRDGPKLQRDLLNILLRFRRYPIAISCDIKEMFPGIAVSEEDRKYLRILWKEKEEDEVKVLELCRLPFGLNVAPFLAICTLLDHAKKYEDRCPRAVEAIVQSTYVDDTLDSAKTESEAVKIYHEVTEICKEAGWEVHKWASNSVRFLDHIPEDKQAKGYSLGSEAEGITMKILGVKWNPDSDELVGEATSVNLQGNKLTKRVVLQKIARIYDPLGLMAPYTMQCKMLLQEIWLEGLDWDDEVSDSLRKRIISWFEELQYAECIKQPRVLFKSDNIKDIEIHCFCDASEKAYGSVIYLRICYSDSEEVVIRWVAAKGKVCPVESISIPRLELMAATLGAQMTDKVRKALEYDQIITRMWTDSMTTLWWIKGRTRDLKLFVGNRVLEIHKYTDPSQWRHVAGEQNPADLISRGCSLQELRKSELWKNGPEFIKKDVQYWPIQVRTKKPKEADREVKKQYLERLVSHLTKGMDNKTDLENEHYEVSTSFSDDESSDDDENDVLVQMKRMDHVQRCANLGDRHVHALEKDTKGNKDTVVKQLKVEPGVEYLTPTRFSCISKLVRLRAYVHRFVHNSSVPQGNRFKGALHVWELKEAETEIIVNEQKVEFKSEYKALLKGETLDKNSELRELNPRLDQDGLMRVEGRIRDHPSMPWAMQCPIILPKQNHVTDLLIKREHERNHMMGTNYLMGRMKEK
jgi:hypothetical protein